MERVKNNKIDISHLEEYYKQKIPNSFFGWLYFFIRKYKISTTFYIINRIIRSILLISAPIMIKIITDYITGVEFQTNPEKVYFLFGIYIVLMAIGFIQLLVFKSELLLRSRIKQELTVFGLNHLMNQSLDWHEKAGTGSKLQRVIKGRNNFDSIIMIFSWTFIPFFASILALLISFLYIDNIKYMLFFVGYMIIYFTGFRLFINPLNKANEVLNNFFENILGKNYEFISSIRTIKSSNLQKQVLGRIQDGETRGIKNFEKYFGLLNIKIFTVDNMIGLLGFSVISLVALSDLIAGNITIGSFLMIFMLGKTAWDRIEAVSQSYIDFLEVKVGFVRYYKLLEQKPDNFDIAPLQKFNDNWQKIEFNKIGFKYNKKAEIFDNLNLEINVGEKIALVGTSGAGKSTLAKLLLKQYLVTSGEIKIGDININNIKTQELLNHMTMVLQEPELFDISIKDNILISAKNPEKLQEYIKKANLSDLVNNLPCKENTLIGERGVKLSGGEKQRLAIARALASEKEIIIFDEATSALDSINEKEIQQTIEKTFENNTMIVIAHRLATIRNVDKIYVFENGRIIESGNFTELLNKNGEFKKLWDMQNLEK
ncbi:MAG: ABC transporter ATP-binding protein/permease [Candidatus Gracilibacteria bacterium]|nr:ABC transporter ATP-binding protein/permease [Candidatus Gracilibacteria bacterium]